jgi:hypothetical protein
MTRLGSSCALIVAILGIATVAHAGKVSGGFGFVPGVRAGAVRGAFDDQHGWGYSTEVHLDLQRTFAGDRWGLALSVGILGHESDAFDHEGLGASLKLMRSIGWRTWATARAGFVSGRTETAPRPIEGTFTRYSVEASRMFKTNVTHVAGHVAVEYMTGEDDDRGYDALALVVGATFVFSNR